jgi:hypothetical protein
MPSPPLTSAPTPQVDTHDSARLDGLAASTVPRSIVEGGGATASYLPDWSLVPAENCPRGTTAVHARGDASYRVAATTCMHASVQHIASHAHAVTSTLPLTPAWDHARVPHGSPWPTVGEVGEWRLWPSTPAPQATVAPLPTITAQPTYPTTPQHPNDSDPNEDVKTERSQPRGRKKARTTDAGNAPHFTEGRGRENYTQLVTAPAAVYGGTAALSTTPPSVSPRQQLPCDVTGTRCARVVMPDGAVVFKCGFCDYTCALRGSVVAHERTHTGEKRFFCSLPGCGYGAGRRWQVTVHERKHTGDKPYPCAHCPKAFRVSGARLAHTRVVHGVGKS